MDPYVVYSVNRRSLRLTRLCTVGGVIATVQNPNSFDNFTTDGQFQFVVPFFKTSGEGGFCFPVDLAAQNISGVKDGANVTIQLIYDGGDGQLYQVRISLSKPSNGH